MAWRSCLLQRRLAGGAVCRSPGSNGTPAAAEGATSRWSLTFQQRREFRKISKKKKPELQEQGVGHLPRVPPSRLARPLLFTLGFSSCSFGAAAIWQYESLKSRVQSYFDQLRADWLENLRPQKRGGFRKESLAVVGCHRIMPEGSQHGSQRSLINTAETWRSSLSSLSAMADEMMSSDRGGSSGPASLSSSTSSVSLHEASRSSSSSSSSSSWLSPISDISLDLRPLEAAGDGALLPPPARQLSRRERVLLEIVETEQAYVRDLKSVVEDYLGPIVDCKALPLSSEDVSTLFCNIEDIYQFNRDLLEDLKRSGHAAAIAECFVERSEDFDIYTLYCMNYPNCVSLLHQCLKNDTICGFFTERQSSLNQSLPVETYLLKPVQRILKYHLLLQELCRHVEPSDPGFQVVEEALVTMTAVAWYINDMKRRQELSVRLKEIEASLVNWTGPSLAGFGDLLLEGSFRVQKVKKERAFFLFEKMLLITKKKLQRFVYSSHIFCCNLALVETLKEPLSFRVWDQNILKDQHTVQTRNQEEKRLWVHFLKKVMVENHPASLPHKARRLLGNQCVSARSEPQQCSTRAPERSPAHQRSRRHSEPQGLLLPSTPERGRRGRHLLLDRSSSHRVCRRRSDPADLKSDGQATPGDVTSCVLQLKAEPHGDQPREQEEEEDLAYVAPPTLSITEEILEIIDQQTRSRETPHSPPKPVILEHLGQVPDPPPELDHDATSVPQEAALLTDTEDSCPTVAHHHGQMEASGALHQSDSSEDRGVLGHSQRLAEERLELSESLSLTSTSLRDQSQDSEPCGSRRECATSASRLDQSQVEEVRHFLSSEFTGDDQGPGASRSRSLEPPHCESKSQTAGPDHPTPEVDQAPHPGQPSPSMWRPTTRQVVKDSGPSKSGAETEDMAQEAPETLTIEVQADVKAESCVQEQTGPGWNQVSETDTKQDLTVHQGLGSYLEGIKLFESSTTSDCDPVVIQNSERILNRVQTLARMYSRWNAGVKVPTNQRPRSWGSRSSASPTGSDHDLFQSKTEAQSNQNQAGLDKNQVSPLSPEISSPAGQQENASRLKSPPSGAHRATLSRPRDFLTLIPAVRSDVPRIPSQDLSPWKVVSCSMDPRETTAQEPAPTRATLDENHQDVRGYDSTQSHTQAALGKPTQTEARRSPHKRAQLPASSCRQPHCSEPGSSRTPHAPCCASRASRRPEDGARPQIPVLAGSPAPSQSRAFPSRPDPSTEPSGPRPPSTFARSLAASHISQSINQSIAKRHSGRTPSTLTLQQQHQGLVTCPTPPPVPLFSSSRTGSLHRSWSAHHLQGPRVERRELPASTITHIPAPQPRSSVSGSPWTPSEAPPGSGSPPTRGQKPTSSVSPAKEGTNTTPPSSRSDSGDHIGSGSWEGPPERCSPGAQEQHLDEGHCRSQLICPYIMPACPGRASICLEQDQRPHQASVEASSRHAAACGRPALVRASYATTVNLQITSRGCITSFSTARLSLSPSQQKNFGNVRVPGGAEEKVSGVSRHGPPPL
ncbi:pleckstrin homology domain-containing family G member 3 isoform X2 [Synchiropus splendidus]|uniref:pleckstrin homology domain-containing family G member 3 isoform X2 n=1 Tax=Synchiropus splendidus TaxID=270530 RepID=UPI00237EE1C4|nr:pleckstrin homology domain-containing family G member 3 isoform X2 [Synchiropus splendidus]